MKYVHFVFLGEGSIDTAYQEHFRKLLIKVGADEVVGAAPDFQRLRAHSGHDVQAKLETAVELEPGANLFLIHRDSDAVDPEPRYDEIRRAVEDVRLDREAVAVVPVQETEAWLLLDEQAIRRAAGNPDGRVNLDLPSPTEVEGIASPKDRLHEVLLEASETSGRRRERFKNRLSRVTAHLLRRLPVEGKIEDVPAWQRLRDDLEDAIEYF